MTPVRFLACSLNQSPIAWAQNAANIQAVLEYAHTHQIGWVCLPELAICGYDAQDLFFAPHVLQQSFEQALKLLPFTKGLVTNFGIPFLYLGALYNINLIAVDGAFVAAVAKQSLANEGIHYEPRWFKSWPRDTQVIATLPNGQEIPFGDVLLEIGGVRLGFEICADAWGWDRVGFAHAKRGVDVVFNPSASHFSKHKAQIRRQIVQEGARALGVVYVFSNQHGNAAGRIVYDGQAMIAYDQQLLEGPQSSFAATETVVAEVELDALRLARSQHNYHAPIPDPHVLRIPFKMKSNSELPVVTHTPLTTYYAEFTQTVALGLWDYLCKSKLSGFLISVSGGLDSAACMILSYYSLKLAHDTHGLVKMQVLLGIQKTYPDFDTLCKQVLYGVYQGTQNNTEQSYQLAQTVCAATGAQFYEWDIHTICQSYQAMVEQQTGIPLSWEEHDLALQNIQARARVPGLWLLANLKNLLLLSTSNRSELSVGYTTLDGDLSGVVGPIAGIDKPFLQDWLQWLVNEGYAGKQWSALQRLCETPPSAELKPQTQMQTDEADLMPYRLLTQIETMAQNQKMSPIQIYRDLTQKGLSSKEAKAAVMIFFQRWARNQFKRERAAIGFPVDVFNVDPKTGCRFPILSGAYVQELQELDQL